MRVFVAGATGVLGRRAIAALVAEAHDVTGVARSSAKAELVRALGAEPVSVDLFDARAVASAVHGHEAVCNFATHIPATATGYWRRSAWKTNDRLHCEVSRHLVDAALASGVDRYLQHSVSFMYADGGDTWLDEDAPVDAPTHGFAVLEAERQAHRFSEAGGAGLALRFGFFYGADAPSARDLVRLARLGFVPMAGRRDAYLPWINTADLGTSVAAALHAPAGIYNVVDDDPLTRSELGAALASAIGRKRLRLVPEMLLRPVGRRFGYLLRSQRVSNRRFRTAADWSPTVPSSRSAWTAVAAETRSP